MSVCTKTAFKDEAAIRRHLTRQRLDHKPRRHGCQASYFCLECGAWHLKYMAKGRKVKA